MLHEIAGIMGTKHDCTFVYLLRHGYTISGKLMMMVAENPGGVQNSILMRVSTTRTELRDDGEQAAAEVVDDVAIDHSTACKRKVPKHGGLDR